MNESCKICGTSLKADLFAAVTQETVCGICKVNHIGGLSTTPERIANARQRLGLSDGEFLKQDRAEEARRILGRP